MRLTRVQQYALGGALVCVALLVGVWGSFHVMIQGGVEKYAAEAQQYFPEPGDDVAALIRYVQSDEHSLRERNHAVWALGQLRDARALPVLEAAYTGEPCNHDLFLCQRELEKAIDLCRGGAPNLMFIDTRKAAE